MFAMSTRIKICCIRSIEEARLAINAGADAVGFVGLVPPTPRTIADVEIARIVAAIPSDVEAVLLSSARDADAIAAQARGTGTRTVQIVHPIGAAELQRLAQIAPALRRVQVIHVEGAEALQLIPLYASHVHAFLLDSGNPNAPVPSYGGTGRTHDWAVSAAFVEASPVPVFLAGGLSAVNVADAIRQVRPNGVDLCTGVRTDGQLDPDKLAAFMAAVRAASAAT